MDVKWRKYNPRSCYCYYCQDRKRSQREDVLASARNWNSRTQEQHSVLLKQANRSQTVQNRNGILVRFQQIRSSATRSLRTNHSLIVKTTSYRYVLKLHLAVDFKSAVAANCCYACPLERKEQHSWLFCCRRRRRRLFVALARDDARCSIAKFMESQKQRNEQDRGEYEI